jgi:hypothetical protein
VKRAADNPALQRGAVFQLTLGHRRVLKVGGHRQHAGGVEVECRDCLGIVEGDASADDRAPVAALHRVALIADPAHQPSQPFGYPGDVHRLGRLVGEGKAGQRRDDHVVARADEQRDQLEKLDRRTGPSVDQQDGQAIAIALARALPDEMDTVGPPVGETVKRALRRAPVVLVGPVVAELAQVGEVHPMLPADPVRLYRPARRVYPRGHVIEDRVVDRDLVGLH